MPGSARAITSACLALALVATPLRARAQPEADPAAEPAHAAAKELYERGKAEYETADFGAAIELWTEAYGSLPDSAETSHIKTLLMYDIARAQERAFDVDRRIDHLRQAKILLEQFRESISALYPSADQAAHERSLVDRRLAELERKIAAAAPRASGPAPAPRPSGKGMVVSGGALIGVGGAALGLMTAGLVLGAQANDLGNLAPDDLDGRREQFDRGRAGNVMAIAGGAIAGAAIVAGAVLLGLGLSRRSAARATVTPTLERGHAGLMIHCRF